MQHLLQHVKNYYPLSQQAQHSLYDCFEKVILSKNEFLVKQGRICSDLYFLEQGALRGFYVSEDKEITHWFGFDNDFVTSFYSFTTGKAAIENIQLLEGSILWKIPKQRLEALYNEHHEIERLVRIAYEKYYLRLEERFVNSHFKTAKELYENLLINMPHIPERVSLGYIASYLGISQETLSRIRGHL